MPDCLLVDGAVRLFRADIDNTQVDELAAVLAESMTIPDIERDEFAMWQPLLDEELMEQRVADQEQLQRW